MSEARIPQAARQLQRTLNQIDHLQEAYNRDWRMHGIFGNVVIRERLQRELAELRRLKKQARKDGNNRNHHQQFNQSETDRTRYGKMKRPFSVIVRAHSRSGPSWFV